MAGRNPSRQQVTVDQRAISERAGRAFSVLGNETRLQILLVLWEVYDPTAETNALTFSELRDRVGMRDSGQFSYHLEKLVGEFVWKTDAGYAIREAGHRLVRAVAASVGVEEPVVDPVETPWDCPFCGATTVVSYEDQHVVLCCTECPGCWRPGDEGPEGQIAQFDIGRAALADRDLLEVWVAGVHEMRLRGEGMLGGVCPECKGPVDRSLHLCADHDDGDGLCEACGNRSPATFSLVCRVCRFWSHGFPQGLFEYHPEVRARFRDHGLPVPEDRFGLDGTGVRPPEADAELDVRSVDPPAVRVTLTHEGTRFAYTVDETLEIGGVTVE